MKMAVNLKMALLHGDECDPFRNCQTNKARARAYHTFIPFRLNVSLMQVNRNVSRVHPRHLMGLWHSRAVGGTFR